MNDNYNGIEAELANLNYQAKKMKDIMVLNSLEGEEKEKYKKKILLEEKKNKKICIVVVVFTTITILFMLVMLAGILMKNEALEKIFLNNTNTVMGAFTVAIIIAVVIMVIIYLQYKKELRKLYNDNDWLYYS